MVGGFHHNADKRLRAGLTNQNAAGVAQCLSHRLDGGLHSGIGLRRLLVGHADIFQHLRIDGQRLGQLAHGQLFGQHDFHHLQAGQDAIAGAGVLAEDNVAALLTTDAAAVLGHVLVNILVAHSGLGVADALFVKGLVQTEVGHHGRDDGIVHQLAMFLQVAAIDVQNVVAGDDIALLVHAQAAVGVAVVGKADVEMILDHELLQALDVGGTGIVVDVQAVRLVVDDVGVGTQSIEHRLRDVPAGTVGAVQADLDSLEGVDAQADEVAHVAVAACHIVHGAADVLAVGKGQLRPVLIEDVELAVDVVLDQQQGLFGHLLAVAVDELDAVVVERVVAGRDHDAAVEVVHAGDVGHRGRRSDVQQIGVCAGGRQTGTKAVLKHVGAAAGVLADDDAGRLVVAVALAELVVIPAEEAAHLVGVVGGQRDPGFAAEAIGPKILSHNDPSFFVYIKSAFVPQDRSAPYIITY